MAIRDYLAEIALFANGVKSTSALQMSRNVNITPSRRTSCSTSRVRRWAPRFMAVAKSALPIGRLKSMALISAMSGRRIERLTGPIAAGQISELRCQLDKLQADIFDLDTVPRLCRQES